MSKHCSIVLFSTFKLNYFVERSSLLRLEAVFLRLEVSRGITIAAENSQPRLYLKLELK